MSKMFPVYDKNFWEALTATVTADAAWTAYSTYCSVSSESTGVMGATPAATTAQLVWVAYEAPINRTHLLYQYST